jgi:hypothetical protein
MLLLLFWKFLKDLQKKSKFGPESSTFFGSGGGPGKHLLCILTARPTKVFGGIIEHIQIWGLLTAENYLKHFPWIKLDKKACQRRCGFCWGEKSEQHTFSIRSSFRFSPTESLKVASEGVGGGRNRTHVITFDCFVPLNVNALKVNCGLILPSLISAAHPSAIVAIQIKMASEVEIENGACARTQQGSQTFPYLGALNICISKTHLNNELAARLAISFIAHRAIVFQCTYVARTMQRLKHLAENNVNESKVCCFARSLYHVPKRYFFYFTNSEVVKNSKLLGDYLFVKASSFLSLASLDYC